MYSFRQIHLSTEVILYIVHFVAADEAHRQKTLYACCLVSHQWYSAAVGSLYEKPQVQSGNSFQKFTATICPGVGARRRRLNLGSFVRHLDLSHLVHHSSNSLTARLLGQVKENLEVFVAPRVSFAVNSLPALSKCTNLRHLDLSLVADSMSFPSLKKALSRLPQLTTLKLPQSTNFDLPEASPTEWPPLLQNMQLSGHISPTMIFSYPWPTSLTSLILKNCTDLSATTMACLIRNLRWRSLRRLTISYANRGLEAESINAVTSFRLPNLTYLNVPGDMVDESLLNAMCSLTTPLALEELEFDLPCSDPVLNFSTVSLVESLEKGLSNIRSIGFSEVYCTDQRIAEDEEIDKVLHENAKQRAQAGAGAEVDEAQVGVYYMF